MCYSLTRETNCQKCDNIPLKTLIGNCEVSSDIVQNKVGIIDEVRRREEDSFIYTCKPHPQAILKTPAVANQNTRKYWHAIVCISCYISMGYVASCSANRF